MRTRFKIPLYLLGILIVFCLFLGLLSFFYPDLIPENSLVIVDSELSINYISGNEFSQRKHQTLKFSVTNNGNEPIYYYLTFTDVTGTAPYNLECTENNISIDNDLTGGTISSYIEIDGNTTQNYVLKFNETENKYKGKIEVKKEATNYKTFADLIMENNSSKETPITEIGEAATTDEGLIKGSDDQGTTYYFRGKITNNYVNFANNSWRIVRINGDGSIKLILNNLLDKTSPYYNESNVDFNNSLIKSELDTYYANYLNSYSDDIATMNYCNDIVLDSNGYTGYNRIMINKIFTNDCLSNKVLTNIGLLTIDEAIFAGASISNSNNDLYLNNSSINYAYYLMSSSKGNSTSYYPFVLNKDGSINNSILGTTSLNIRPVINIIKNVSASGTGTIDDPYLIMPLES
jgi:hypothetical protein